MPALLETGMIDKLSFELLDPHEVEPESEPICQTLGKDDTLTARRNVPMNGSSTAQPAERPKTFASLFIGNRQRSEGTMLQ